MFCRLGLAGVVPLAICLGARLRNIEQSSRLRTEIQPEQPPRAALPGHMDPDWDEVSCLLSQFFDLCSHRNAIIKSNCLSVAFEQLPS
jgi:hypothetical protein